MHALAALHSLLEHAAPAVYFDAHARARIPARWIPVSHRAGPKPTDAAVRTLRHLLRFEPHSHDELFDFYSKMDGADLFIVPDGRRETPMLRLLPIERWESATRPWFKGGRLHFLAEGCDMYELAVWRVIARLPHEQQCIAYFFEGNHRRRPLAGRLFCISMDPIVGFTEQIAPSFDSFVKVVTSRPATFFRRIGFNWFAASKHGVFGGPIAGYVADSARSRAIRDRRPRT